MKIKVFSHWMSRSLCLLFALLLLPATAGARTEISPTYTATLVAREFKHLDPDVGERLVGVWMVQFLPGDAFQMVLNGEIMVDGYWSLKDDQISLSQMSGPLVCDEDGATEAGYRVSIRGFSIRMEQVVDSCPERTAVLTLGNFRAVAR